MSKSSSKSTHSNAKKYPSKTNVKAQKRKNPKRSTLLAIVLVLMALHGIFAAVLFYAQNQAFPLGRNWMLSLMVLHSLADVVAVVAIWYWKKWGLYVYAASAILGTVVGMMAVGWSAALYFILPVAIVAYLLRYQWETLT